MKVDPHYLVCLQSNGRMHYLLWRGGNSEPDRFATLSDPPRLLVSSEKAPLLGRAATLKLQVHQSPPHVIDMDAMQRVLLRLRPSTPMSQGAAEILLESWNAIDDLARSVGISFHSSLRSNDLELIYEKLFYANNLPAVTPPNRRYQLGLTSEERQKLRSSLRGMWREICKYVEVNEKN